MMQRLITYLIVFAILLPGTAQQALANVTGAKLIRSTISMDEVTAFQIVVEDTESKPTFNLPQAKGIDFGDISTSSQQSIQIINGRTTRSYTTTYTIPIRVNQVGILTIPAWQIELDGKTFTITQQEITVTQSPYILRLDDDGPIYVGQTATLNLLLYVDEDRVEDISNVGQPSLQSDSFLLGAITEQPEQAETSLNGKRYLVVRWKHTLTPTISGEQELEYSLPIAIRTGRNSRFDDRLFGSSLFDRFNTERRDIYSGPLKLNVQALPEPQPEGFTGGIGTFTVSTRLNATERSVGEPFSLFVEVSGTGNFSRLEAPVMPNSPAFRVYPPKAETETTDPFALQGIKRFEILLDPLSAETTEIPGLAFCYFDPQKEDYVSITTDPLPITIKPAPENTRFRQPVVSNSQQIPLPELNNEPALLDIKKTPGKWVSSVSPSFKQPAVLATQAIPLLAFSALCFIRKRQLRLCEDNSYSRLHKASQETREALAKADEAAKCHDAENFFKAAEHALKHSLARLSDSPVESLVSSEVANILKGNQADSKLCKDVQDFLNEAEQVKFAGASATGDLASHASAIKAIIQQVEALR